METSYACDKNTIIQEKWLDDVVYKITDTAGGAQHVHINQYLIRVVAALDHDYCAQKVNVKDALNGDDTFMEEFRVDRRIDDDRSDGDLLAEDHRSEDTLTAEEDVDVFDDGWSGVSHNLDRSKIGHEITIKIEQHDLPAKGGIEETEDRRNNLGQDQDRNCSVLNSMMIKKECCDYDDTKMDTFHKNTGMSGTQPDDYHSADPEEHYGNVPSPGEFIEEIHDGWNDVSHDPDGNNSIHILEIEKGQHNYECNIDGTVMDGFCTIGKSEAETNGFCSMATEENFEETAMSPGDFVEEIDDGWISGDDDPCGEYIVNGTAIEEQQEYKHNNGDTIMGSSIGTKTKNGDSLDMVRDTALSTEECTVERDIDKHVTDDWSYSLYDEIIEDEEYDLSAEKAVGENDIAADPDGSWSPRKRAYNKKKAKRPKSLKGTCDRKKATPPKTLNRAYTRKKVTLPKSPKRAYNKKNKVPFVCRSCGYECDCGKVLQCHIQSSETCKKPYACNQCDKRYVKSYSLKRHLMNHTVEEPFMMKYSCDICDYGTQSSSTMKRHKFIHSGEKPYSCSVCIAAFRQPANLDFHMKRYHGSALKAPSH